MKPFAYHRPGSLDEALALKQRLPGSRFLAGGTDLLVKMKSGALAPEALISLRGVQQLRGIEISEQGTSIGALTPMSEILAHPGIQQRHPLLSAAIARIANPQIRNAATLGGNFANASPCADTPPALLVLEAQVIAVGPRGRRRVPIEEFFVGPGHSSLASDEILAALWLDPPRPGSRSVFLKHGRMQVDLSLVNVAVQVELQGLRFTGVRAAAGAVAPVPLRLRGVEQLLLDNEATPELLAEAQDRAAAEVSPITDVRTSAGYRRRLTGVLLRRGLERLLGWSEL